MVHLVSHSLHWSDLVQLCFNITFALFNQAQHLKVNSICHKQEPTIFSPDKRCILPSRMPLSEMKIHLHRHSLLLTECLSTEEHTQIVFWWLHELLKISSTLSTRHWPMPYKPIQGYSTVFWPLVFEFALALCRAAFLHVLMCTETAKQQDITSVTHRLSH